LQTDIPKELTAQKEWLFPLQPHLALTLRAGFSYVELGTRAGWP
jgi:hypothetical protein